MSGHINISKLYKSFTPKLEDSIIKNLNVTILESSFVSLLGPSGCGKTTLLRCLAGLAHPTAGQITQGSTVFFDSQKNVKLNPEKRNLGFVFQNYALWPHMTVFENIAYPLKIKKVDKLTIENKVQELTQKMDIDHLHLRLPKEISGGQQQRVALARSLVTKPKLLLLDEPLSNLDASLRDNMRKEIKKIQKETGITCILVTHDWKDASSLSDRVIILNKGSIEQDDSVQNIEQNPATDFVKSLIVK